MVLSRAMVETNAVCQEAADEEGKRGIMSIVGLFCKGLKERRRAMPGPDGFDLSRPAKVDLLL
jgi:hypothetical protein